MYPFLTYALIAWGNTYATTLKPVVVLQKKAVRIITFFNEILTLAETSVFTGSLIKLMDLVTIHTALFKFQYHHYLLPKAFDYFFSRISSKHNYDTRLASTSFYYNIDHVRTNYNKFRQAMMKNFNLIHLRLMLAWYCQFILSLLLFKTSFPYE